MTLPGHRGRRAAVAALALLLVPTGCSESDDPPKQTSTGLLTVEDLPFEPSSDGDLSRPPILTQLGTSCIGIEQGVLYRAGWTVRAREFYDGADWSVVSALLTPPGKGGAPGLQQVSDRLDACVAQDDGTGTVTPLSLGGVTFGYEVRDASGDFDSARGYRELPGGRLAQVSLLELPEGQDATRVLKDLLGRTDS